MKIASENRLFVYLHTGVCKFINHSAFDRDNCISTSIYR